VVLFQREELNVDELIYCISLANGETMSANEIMEYVQHKVAHVMKLIIIVLTVIIL